jgi:hypothetical protein
MAGAANYGMAVMHAGLVALKILHGFVVFDVSESSFSFCWFKNHNWLHRWFGAGPHVSGTYQATQVWAQVQRQEAGAQNIQRRQFGSQIVQESAYTMWN